MAQSAGGDVHDIPPMMVIVVGLSSCGWGRSAIVLRRIVVAILAAAYELLGY
jgi:hypothetical protein